MRRTLRKERRARRALSSILRNIADWVDSGEPLEESLHRVERLYNVTRYAAIDWLSHSDSVDWIAGQND